MSICKILSLLLFVLILLNISNVDIIESMREHLRSSGRHKPSRAELREQRDALNDARQAEREAQHLARKTGVDIWV